jgi:Family of unknown function (DUF6221)
VSDDPVARLRAGLDAEEAIAKAPSPSGRRRAWKASIEAGEDGAPIHWVVSDPDPAAVAQGFGLERGTGPAVIRHIARQDPEHTLRVIAFMRRILGRYLAAPSRTGREDVESLAGIYCGEEAAVSEVPRSTEVPAALARQITGRCGQHDCALDLVPYADEGLGDLMEAWCCPGIHKDPDVLALQEKEAALSRRHPLAMDQWPQSAVDERKRHWARGRELRERCENSWVLIIPAS